jgi:hypothetical protein
MSQNMGRSVEFKISAEKELDALEDRIQIRILKEIKHKRGKDFNPRALGL